MSMELRCYFARIHKGEIGGCRISLRCAGVKLCDIEVFWVVFNLFYSGMAGHSGWMWCCPVGTELLFPVLYFQQFGIGDFQDLGLFGINQWRGVLSRSTVVLKLTLPRLAYFSTPPKLKLWRRQSKSICHIISRFALWILFSLSRHM